MPTEKRMLYNRRLLTDVDAFAYYRNNAKHRDVKNTYRREVYSVLVKSFYKKVADKMIENPNGVFLRNFGYFTMLMNPKKTTVNMNRSWTSKSLILNPHTKGRVFHPIFLHICNNFKFKLFIMDKSFSRKLKMKLKDKLRAKVKYFNHYGILNSMYKNKR